MRICFNVLFALKMQPGENPNNVNRGLYRNPFSISQLAIGLVLSTYFLTVEVIELSLSIYAVQENKPETYREYLIFKPDAPIWKQWQLLTLLLIPLSIKTAINDLYQIFTTRATTRRNLIDVVTALQLFGILFTVFKCAQPLETQLVKISSYECASELNFFHWIMLVLNIVGWLIPIFRYHEWKNNPTFYP